MSFYPDSSNATREPASQNNPDMNQGSILRVLMQNVVFCTAIALALWMLVPALGQYGFFSNFVHAQAIGNSIALLSIAFSRWATAAGFGSRWETFLSIVVATALGIVVGLWLAGTLLGLHTRPLEFLYNIDHFFITAVTAVLASLAFNWHRYRREKLMRLELIASEERRRADNAHHAMLRAQLDPHMLFNTLANLRALIGHDTAQALEMLDRLDSFLRETLRSSRATHHALARELKVLEDYLALMKVRMAERLTYSFTVAQACNNIQVPALILQPLIENAIRHGIEPLIEGGHINVGAELENNTLTLVVEDTGIGMKPSTTVDADKASAGAGTNTEINTRRNKSSQTGKNPASSDGFGLENLRQRLHQTYGDQASLTFAQAKASGKGTRVTIQLPDHFVV